MEAISSSPDPTVNGSDDPRTYPNESGNRLFPFSQLDTLLGEWSHQSKYTIYVTLPDD